jgi:hypothetical protein
MSLLVANTTYVLYRLMINGTIVHFLNKHTPYYIAVFVMSQLSFAYDTLIFGYYFNALQIPLMSEYVIIDIIYTIRVLVAWWLIRQLHRISVNYWGSVLVVAELTFIADWFIFKGVFR